jgi:glycerophosphoryl diester phosphodiesterase
MDGVNDQATNIDDYIKGTASWRTELYQTCDAIVTHKESIKLFQQQGVKMIPELKQPRVEMPFEGSYYYEDYADQFVQEYVDAGVNSSDVLFQTFDLQIVYHWLEHAGKYKKRIVYLDDRLDSDSDLIRHPEKLTPSFSELASRGLTAIAPPLWVLVDINDGAIRPSSYALAAKAAGLSIFTWTLERSGPIRDGGGWYYQSIADFATNDGVVYKLLDILAKKIGVEGVFSDWPATTTFYANCMAIP